MAPIIWKLIWNWKVQKWQDWATNCYPKQFCNRQSENLSQIWNPCDTLLEWHARLRNKCCRDNKLEFTYVRQPLPIHWTSHTFDHLWSLQMKLSFQMDKMLIFHCKKLSPLYLCLHPMTPCHKHNLLFLQLGKLKLSEDFLENWW